MAYYCKRCNVANYENVCECCGKKNLPEVEPGDPCFIVELSMKIYVPYKDIDEALDIYEAIFFPQDNSQDNSQDNQNHNSQDNSQDDRQGDLKDNQKDDNTKER